VSRGDGSCLDQLVEKLILENFVCNKSDDL
jgi:hypothetical protein